MTTINHFYDPVTFYAAGSLPAPINPDTGFEVTPANATTVAPPASIPAGSVALWNEADSTWSTKSIEPPAPTPPPVTYPPAG